MRISFCEGAFGRAPTTVYRVLRLGKAFTNVIGVLATSGITVHDTPKRLGTKLIPAPKTARIFRSLLCSGTGMPETYQPQYPGKLDLFGTVSIP